MPTECPSANAAIGQSARPTDIDGGKSCASQRSTLEAWVQSALRVASTNNGTPRIRRLPNSFCEDESREWHINDGYQKQNAICALVLSCFLSFLPPCWLKRQANSTL